MVFIVRVNRPSTLIKKLAVFLKNECYDQFFAFFSFVLSQKLHFFADSKKLKIGPRFQQVYSGKLLLGPVRGAADDDAPHLAPGGLDARLLAHGRRRRTSRLDDLRHDDDLGRQPSHHDLRPSRDSSSGAPQLQQLHLQQLQHLCS
jgi:hypothetical protein